MKFSECRKWCRHHRIQSWGEPDRADNNRRPLLAVPVDWCRGRRNKTLCAKPNCKAPWAELTEEK